jgi:ribonuclease R
LAKKIIKDSPRPTKRQLTEFIAENSGNPSRREIARAFRLHASDQAWLRATLKELEDDGQIERKRGKRVGPPGRLPPVAVIEVTHVDDDGDVFCRPTATNEGGDGDGETQTEDITIRLRGDRGRPATAGVGDRMLARLTRIAKNVYDARTIRKLGSGPRDFIGVYEGSGRHGSVRPVDRRIRTVYEVSARNSQNAEDGDYVRAEALGGGHRRAARVIERLGPGRGPKVFSLVALHSRDIPIDFPADAITQSEGLQALPLGKRTDLRDTPLITIDGADARDFDDAVWAEPDDSAKNKNGWHAIVAIADVTWYVRPGDPLDRSARDRGNSIYFPDRVVPMLPERLSNGLCSLRPDEERACLAVHLWIDANGRVIRHKFVRGLMRSAARLTYEQAQSAIDGITDDTTAPILDTVVKPLFGAYAALLKARKSRGTLDLDLPERRIVLDDDGHVSAIVPRARLDSHRLIEELMIAANVAAAETLQKAEIPVPRRIHQEPDSEALEALRQSLDGFGIRLAKGAVVKPALFAGILEQAAGTDFATMVSDLVLRSQTQAFYGADDEGHFGLALRRYCHFTSPIRRYADVLVHRALVSALKLGDGGLGETDIDRIDETSEHISMTERRAAYAERDTVDRLTTAYLADKVGAQFSARISGVARFGLFVRLDETGADGLVPMRALPSDWYEHDEVGHRLVGEKSGMTYALGETVTVELVEADVATGSLAFTIIGENGQKTEGTTGKGRPPRRRRTSRKAKGQRKRGK